MLVNKGLIAKKIDKVNKRGNLLPSAALCVLGTDETRDRYCLVQNGIDTDLNDPLDSVPKKDRFTFIYYFQLQLLLYTASSGSC